MSFINEYADSMGFLDRQGQPPLFDPSKRPQLSIAHLTSVRSTVKSFEETLAAHRAFKAWALCNPDVHEIRTREDVSGKLGSMGLLFGLQHAPSDLTRDRVQQLFDEGIRSMAIAYDGQNEYGGGFKSDAGLIDRGRELIEWMSECGIIPDFSHANHKTARTALDFIRKENLPMKPMASHSAYYSKFPHQRNLTDEIIQEICFLNGYIGILAITFYLAKKGGAYLELFAQHIERIINVCGGDDTFVGIGSDCIHRDMTMEEAEIHFWEMTQILETSGTFGEFFPDRPPELILEGSRMFEIFEETLLKTFTPMVVAGLCGRNFKSFLERSLPRV